MEKTLNDFKDMRVAKVYKDILGIPEVKEPDEIGTLVHDAYYFNRQRKPKIVFLADSDEQKESGFLVSRITKEGLTASVSNDATDIIKAVLEIIGRSLLLKVVIENHETIHLFFIAPVEIGITDKKKPTKLFAVTLKRSIGKLSWHPNSEINMFGFDSMKPVETIPESTIKYFTFDGNKIMRAQNISELYDIENFFKENYPETFPSTDVEACIDRAYRRACQFKTDYINPLEGYSPSTKMQNRSAFYQIENWYDLQCAIEKSIVMEIIPGNLRQIYMVFRCKEIVGYEVIRRADIDADYTVRRINGCLRAVGSFEYEKRDTVFFSAAFSPVVVDPDYGTEEFAITAVFPGYPELNPLFDGLKEGDIILGSEVNARRLQPVAPEEND